MGAKSWAQSHAPKFAAGKVGKRLRRQAAVARTRQLLTPRAGRRVPVTDPALRCLVGALLR